VAIGASGDYASRDCSGQVLLHFLFLDYSNTILLNKEFGKWMK